MDTSKNCPNTFELHFYQVLDKSIMLEADIWVHVILLSGDRGTHAKVEQCMHVSILENHPPVSVYKNFPLLLPFLTLRVTIFLSSCFPILPVIKPKTLAFENFPISSILKETHMFCLFFCFPSFFFLLVVEG